MFLKYTFVVYLYLLSWLPRCLSTCIFGHYLFVVLVTQVPEYVYPTDHVPDYLSILIPNVDNIRTDFLIRTIASQEKAVLLIGEQVTSRSPV